MKQKTIKASITKDKINLSKQSAMLDFYLQFDYSKYWLHRLFSCSIAGGVCTSKAAYNEKSVKNICGDYLFKKMCAAMKTDTGTLDLNGYAIAVGRLIDSRPMRLQDVDAAFVKHSTDLHAHVYTDVRAIEPFAWKGQLGLREITEETKFNTPIPFVKL